VAGKSKLGKRVESEDADFEHLRAGQRADAVEQPAAIRDPNHAGRVRLGDVIHADQPD
jgi:hypothetical protein